jgi:dihydroxyacetone kinase
VNWVVTRIFDDPRAFADKALAGLAAANPGYVIRVDGGIVRAASSRPGEVAVIIGGGSGHYPAFAGLVGPGLATAAVCGNVFASPSAGQAYQVACSVENGGGVLFSYGNYAGDRMQFGQAEQRLRQAGIDARTVVVTDDIASARADQSADRRGIAGGLAVFKVAGSAADAGLSLDEVERLAGKANSMTRTLGVAFGGCTLPGADDPLFTVPPGQMSIGLGIHGEPGVREVQMPSAFELAEMLVSSLVAEKPEGSQERAVVLLNGLGTIKYEELYVLFGDVAAQLHRVGVDIVDVECGEFVTSLDMSGLSLTLFWVDDELDAWWSVPADTPGYKKAAHGALDRRDVAEVGRHFLYDGEDATAASRQLALLATDMIAAAAEVLRAHEEELGGLDAVAGDGDHGAGMRRGADGAAEVARAKLEHRPGVRELLAAMSEEWSDRAGGASGALWSAGLLALASSLGNREAYGAEDLVNAAVAARDAMAALGQAEPGDKTLLDAVFPFVATLEQQLGQHQGVAEALRTAATSATQAAAGTAPLRPRKGRARPLADRSVGTPDPGAVSFALVVTAIADQAAFSGNGGPATPNRA